MTLRELRYLVALANRAHFGRAAEDCHVSQPTLSTQIRKTRGISRDHLGGSRREIVRADRNGPGCGREGAADRRSSRCTVGLEADPSWTFDGAAQFGRDSDAGTLSAAAVAASRQGTLQTAATRGARGPHRAPPGATARLSDRCGVCWHCRWTARDFDEMPLFDEPFWLACPPQHPLARLKVVTEADLRGETVLLLADGHLSARPGAGRLRA